MIGKLTGVIAHKREDTLMIDVHGVGYMLCCSARTLQNLPDIGVMASVYVETMIKNEQLTLYGFLTPFEKECFLTLLRVQGVGSRVALSILSALTPEQIVNAIHRQEEKNITIADGVGPKVAQRIVRELRDKIGTLLSYSSAVQAPGSLGNASFVSSEGEKQQSHVENAFHDVLSALENLGYKRVDSMRAIQEMQKDANIIDLPLNQLIPIALKYLS